MFIQSSLGSSFEACTFEVTTDSLMTFDTSQSRVKIKDYNIQLLTMDALDMM